MKERESQSSFTHARTYLFCIVVQASPWILGLMQAAARHATEPCDPNIPFFNGWMEICIGFTPDMIRDEETRLRAAGIDTTVGGGYPYNRTCCEWGDQGALMQTIQKYGAAGREHVRYDGFREYSSHFPFYDEGDLVVHMPGSTLCTFPFINHLQCRYLSVPQARRHFFFAGSIFFFWIREIQQRI